MNDTFAYDVIAYPSKIFSQTNPDRLAVMAKIFGMSPPDVENCRVLELGCGNGSNLFAQAFIFPTSRFVGIDLSENHILDAKKGAEELGLTNIEFRQIDVMEMTEADFGKFDYIIAHGLISWIPDFVRERVFEIYHELLTPNGIGYISYNTYPGGHIRDMARRIMRFHTRDTDKPTEKVQKAMTFLAFLVENSIEKEAFQPFLTKELERHFDHETADIYHDDLAEFYQPVYFYEFVETLQKHGLQFLSESEITAMSMHSFSKDVQEMINSLGSIEEREQYLDFLRGRFFRQTLICHQEVELNRQIDPSILQDFYISSPIRPLNEITDLATRKVEKFVGRKNAGVEIDHPLTKAALIYLGEIFANSADFNELIENARRILEENNFQSDDWEQERNIITQIFWQMYYSTGLIEINVNRRKISTNVGDKPQVNRLAAWQIKHGANISTYLGTSIKIDDEISHRLIELMDGTRTRAELLDEIQSFVESLEDMENKELFLKNLPVWINENIDYSAKMGLFEEV